jgi:steroid delta-isomerase-like uncharacterized protein
MTNPKEIVVRFNREVIEQGRMEAFAALVSPDFVNRTPPAGSPTGPDGFAYFFTHVLWPALGELQVAIHEQVAEGDKVTTRKTISGLHRGTFFGVPATGRRVSLDVIDIYRVQNGKLAEHWNIADLQGLFAQLKG